MCNPYVASACLSGLSALVCFNMLKCICLMSPKKGATLCVSPYVASACLSGLNKCFGMISYAFMQFQTLSYNFKRFH